MKYFDYGPKFGKPRGSWRVVSRMSYEEILELVDETLKSRGLEIWAMNPLSDFLEFCVKERK